MGDWLLADGSLLGVWLLIIGDYLLV